jgi:hypothetical protein
MNEYKEGIVPYHEYKEGIVSYYKFVAFHTLPAIVLGLMCEKTIYYIQHKYKLKPITAIFLQLCLITLLFYVIELQISQSYGSQWQDITPGLFFISIFFGSQSSLYTNINLLL